MKIKRKMLTVTVGILILSAALLTRSRIHSKNTDLFIANIEALTQTENGDDSFCKPAIGYCWNPATHQDIRNAVIDATKFY